MFNLNYLLCYVVLTNLILVQSVIDGYKRNNSSCNDFKLVNGRIRMKSRGRLIQFTCNSGYKLAGDKYIHCINGTSGMPPPVCVKPTCTQFKQLTNGMILSSHNGGVANFYCKPGFTLNGSNISYCDGSIWSHNLPDCISTDLPTPMSCDFETEDLCGWSHDLNHDFDWRRQKLQTPSSPLGTGPKHDHTKGRNQDGYYMYIESTARLKNDVARLISPVYPRQPHGMCFTFWYYMFLRDMGQLCVYLQEAASSRRMKLLWSKQGNQGDVWRKGKVLLQEGINENFQIIIEGVCGSYISDIAIDDVILSESCVDDDDNSSLTTEFSTDEDYDVYFGSCDNKCNNNNTEIIMSGAGSCECNESCRKRNTCCSDYTIVCLSVALDEYSTDFSKTYITTEMEKTEKYQSTPSIAEVVLTTPIDHIVNKQKFLNTTKQQTSSPKPVITIIPNTSKISLKTTLKPTTNNTINNTEIIKLINTNNNTRNITKSEQIPITTTSTPFSVTVTTELNTSELSDSRKYPENYEYILNIFREIKKFNQKLKEKWMKFIN